MQAIIALGAMARIAQLVQQVGQTGQCDEHSLKVMLGSVLTTNPDSAESIYSDASVLKAGYRAIVDQLDSGNSKSIDTVKYVGSLIQLERHLAGRNGAMNELGAAIDELKRKADHFELTDSAMLEAFANTYSQHISVLGPRIQVFGQPALLKQTHVQHTIRALLLAGIRAAVLWRQLGGKRRHFIFAKGAMVKAAKARL